MFLWTYKMQFLQPRRKNIGKRSEIFPLNVQKRKKFLFKKLFSSKCSSGRIECSYGNPSERKKYAKVLSMFAQCPEMINTLFLTKTKIFLRMFLWPTRRQFRQLWPTVFAYISIHFVAQCPKKIQLFFKMYNLPKKFCWNCWMQFWQPCQKVRPRGPENFCIMSRSD